MQGMDTGFSPSVIACFTAISIPKQRTRLCCCYLQLSSLWWVKRFSCWTHSWCFHSLLLSPSWLFSFPPLNNMLKFSGWSWWRDGLFVCLSVVWRFGRWSSKKSRNQEMNLSLCLSPFILLLFSSDPIQQRVGTLFFFNSIRFVDGCNSPSLPHTLQAATFDGCELKQYVLAFKYYNWCLTLNILFIPFHILLRSSS